MDLDRQHGNGQGQYTMLVSHMSISVEIPRLFLPHFKFQVEWCLQFDLEVFTVRAVC